MTASGLLVVLPCGKAKVWDRNPEAGPTPPKTACTGAPFGVNRRFSECFASRWVILSAKYGFIHPDFIIPAPYDLSFKKKDPRLVAGAALRGQVVTLRLAAFRDAIILGGTEYRDVALAAFAGCQTRLRFPFSGEPVGRSIAATKRVVAEGEAFLRKALA
jgi:hypothetical protein